MVGLGNSTLEDVVREVAESSGRFVKPDPEPEKGFFYRSDHFEFARQGVPALYINPGTEFLSRPDGFGRQKRDNYTLRDYHKVSDEIKPDWNLEGAVEDIQLLFQVGHRVAEREALPHWKPGAVFKKNTRENAQKTCCLSLPPAPQANPICSPLVFLRQSAFLNLRPVAPTGTKPFGWRETKASRSCGRPGKFVPTKKQPESKSR